MFGFKFNKKRYSNTKSYSDDYINSIKVWIIIDGMKDDWIENRYKDKISITKCERENILYKLENGRFIEFGERFIKFNQEKYYLSVELYNSVYVIFKTIINQIRDGIATDRNGNANTKKYTDNPKRHLYESLVSTIKNRVDQLSKMSKNDPDRPMLENELCVARKKKNEIKNKYNFN